MYNFSLSVKLDSTRQISQGVDKYLSEAKSKIDISDEAFYIIVLSMVEALNNAAEHGNKFNPEKFVYLTIQANTEHIILTVKDEGDDKFIPDIEAAEALINSEENKTATRGRGVFLISQMMHNVKFETSNGTKITMEYRFDK